jgi:hypothetical protein
MGLTRIRAEQISDIDYKQAVRAVATSSVVLGGGAPTVVDGVNLVLNDRVLVTNQNTGSQNGLYYVATLGTGANGTWARTTDGNENGEIEAGMIVMVTEGTSYADTQWKLTTNNPITVGSTALTFVQNYSTNSIIAGTSNVVVNSNSNVTISSAGTSNVLVVTSTGANITGTVSASGNISGSFILGNGSQLSGIVTSANTLTGNTLSSNVVNSSLTSVGTLGSLSVTGNINNGGAININSTTGNYNVLNISGTALAQYGTPQTWKFFTNNTALGGNPSFILFPDSSTQTTAYPGTSSTLSLSGNITSANLNVTGNIVDTGALSIITGSSGNISLVPGGTNVLVATTTGANITGTLNATGNANVGNLGATNIVGTLTTAAQTNITSVGTLGSLTVTANVAGGNLTTGGQVSATGNVSGGNVNTARVVASSFVSASGNVVGGNVNTAGSMSAVGNITATGTITSTGATNSTGFAVGNSAVSNVGLGFFPTAGTRGDYAIRDYSNVTSTMYFDVGMGGSAAGEFQFRTSNAFTLLMRANSTGVYSPGVVSATGIVSGLELTSTQSSGDEGGQLNLAKAATNTTLAGNIIVDIYQNRFRIFENGGTNRGAYIDLTAANASVGTNLLSGGGTPGGANTNVQFNDAGTFGGNGQFVYNKVTNIVTAGAFAGNTNGTGQNFQVGDDAWIGDINTSDTIGLKGQQNPANAYLVFGNSDSTGKLGRAGTGPLTYAGAFSATGNITGGNIIATNLTGTLLTAAQPNITSVGTLSSLTVNGAANITGNLSVTGNITATGNLNYQNVSELVVGDPLIFLGATNTGNLVDLGFIVTYNDGLDQHGGWVRDATDGTWKLFGNVVPEPTTTVDFTNAIYQPMRAGAITATTGAFSSTLSAAGNVTGSNLNVTGNIVDTGALSIITGSSGNVSLAPNGTNVLVATTTGANITGTLNATGNANLGNLGATTVVATTLTGTLSTAAQTNITSVGTLTSLGVTGNITGGNLSGTSIVGTLTTAAQTNITSVGTLGSLAVTGNTTSGNFVGTLNGSGANVTSISATNISSGTLAQARLANASLTVNGTAIALGGSGTVTATATNALTIGTGLGGTSYNGSTGVTITNTGVTSVVAGTNIAVSGATGAVTVSVTGTVPTATSATTAGTVTTAAQGNITSVGTLTSLGISGSITSTAATALTTTVTGTNSANLIYGNMGDNDQFRILVGATASNQGFVEIATADDGTEPIYVRQYTGVFSSLARTATLLDGSGNTSFPGTVTASGQLSATGNITGGNVITTGSNGNITGANVVNATTISTTQIVNAGANLTGNIGNSTTYFNTVFAKATSAQYADVAENYLADSDYAIGTVLEFGGNTEITISTESHSSAVAGTVSDKPAYIMNSGLTGEYVTTVALLGRVPCRVVGKIRKGNLLVASRVPGVATALDKAQWQPGCVFGKSLEDYDSDQEGMIEIVVGRF